MSSKLEKYLANNNRNKVFVNKTFSDFRKDLLRYANEFYSENILDFSETSLGGMFLDFASIVGDSLVYYAEQQFNEINFETAVDPENISRFVREANIKGLKPSPSSVDVTITLQIVSNNKDTIDDNNLLPIIHENSTLRATNGVFFVLDEEVDFNKGYKIRSVLENDDETYTFFIYKNAMCTSGTLQSETFTFDNSEGNFLKYELENSEITRIVSVFDEESNEYFEVDYLSQDFVFYKVKNAVKEENYLSIRPAPYRYITEDDFETGLTTLRFGNGNNKSFSNDVVPDPLDILLPLKNKNYTNRIEISPVNILNSNLLGISPTGKTLTVTYKYGGGKSHNVSRRSITSFDNLLISFPNVEIESDVIENIKNSITVINDFAASGGAAAPDLNEIKDKIKNSKKMQSRIVTYEDLLTSLSIMPSDFGKIYKAAALDNENFVGLKDIYIVCKNADDYLENASDALKMNISKYINENRLIGNNFNILDAAIFNFGINLKIKIKKGFNELTVKAQLERDIVNLMRFDSYDIGEGIDVNKLTKIVESNLGVLTILTQKNNIIVSKSAEDNTFDFNRNISYQYSNNRFNPISLNKDGVIFPPKGCIFELKNLFDIKITVSN
jgi:hypothetical protein